MIRFPEHTTLPGFSVCRTAVLSAGLLLCTGPAAAEYVLSLEGTGLREYYCQITVSLENKTDAPLTEISGYFYNFIGSEQVGRSKGTWFMGVAPGATTTATFETPNAPCDDVERYEFVLGACRLDGSGFEDVALCAAEMRGTGPIVIATPDGS